MCYIIHIVLSMFYTACATKYEVKAVTANNTLLNTFIPPTKKDFYICTDKTKESSRLYEECESFEDWIAVINEYNKHRSAMINTCYNIRINKIIMRKIDIMELIAYDKLKISEGILFYTDIFVKYIILLHCLEYDYPEYTNAIYIMRDIIDEFFTKFGCKQNIVRKKEIHFDDYVTLRNNMQSCVLNKYHTKLDSLTRHFHKFDTIKDKGSTYINVNTLDSNIWNMKYFYSEIIRLIYDINNEITGEIDSKLNGYSYDDLYAYINDKTKEPFAASKELNTNTDELKIKKIVITVISIITVFLFLFTYNTILLLIVVFLIYNIFFRSRR